MKHGMIERIKESGKDCQIGNERGRERETHRQRDKEEERDYTSIRVKGRHQS